MLVRPAIAADRTSVIELYNHYVEHSPATFDVNPFTLESRRPWFELFNEQGPHQLLVAEQLGEVWGYASSTPFHKKPAYATSAETSVYVRSDRLGRGIGKQLYSALFQRLAAQKLHRLYAGITLPNPASLKLHFGFGFTRAATYHEVGFKLGRYWDVTWLEKCLDAS